MSNKKIYTIGILLSTIFIICACTQTGSTQPSPEPPTETIVTTTSSSANETPTILPTATESYNEDSTQITISNEITTIEITTTPFTFNDVTGTRYRLSEPGLLLGVLPDNQILLRSENNSISIVDLTHSTARKLVENVRFPIEIAPTAQRIIVPLPSETKQYPIWSIGFQGESPKLLGTTTGFFPFYSTTDDEKVVLIENGHLVLKWYEDDQLKSQPLEQLEERLDLQWHTYDLTKAPDENDWATPWIDFQISPDGKYIAIFDGNHTNFWLMTVNGTLTKDIALNPTIPKYDPLQGMGPQVDFLTWSPNSEYLALREGIWGSFGGSTYQQLKIASIDKEAPLIELTFPEDSIAGDVSWSANSEYLTYSAKVWGVFLEGKVKETYLYTRSLKDTDTHQIFGMYYASSYWDQGNLKVYFNCWDAESDNINICSIELAELLQGANQ